MKYEGEEYMGGMDGASLLNPYAYILLEANLLVA